MLRKIIDGKSLEISQENVYEEVPFSNLAIKIAHHIYLLEYVLKTSCLKEQHFEKKVYGGPAY